MGQARSPERDLRDLVVPDSARLVQTEDPWEPIRLLDCSGERIEAVALYLKDLLAAGSPVTTLRSYGMDLLRWWRFLAAVNTCWDRAVREDARDFMLWMQVVDKPVRVHWRHRDQGPEAPELSSPRKPGRPAPGTPNLTAPERFRDVWFGLVTAGGSRTQANTAPVDHGVLPFLMWV
jgi:hypothetical protein